MKKRIVLTTIVAIILLAAAIAAGLNAIFTVTHVRAEFTTYSEEGRAEAAELREKLDAYIGKSSTFLDLEEVKRTVEEYPCFRLESIEKQYPTTIKLVVSERKETFAFSLSGGGFAVIDETGRYLYDSTENSNRVSGANILLDNFSLTTEGNAVKGEYFEELLSAMSAFAKSIGEIRSNVVSVTLVKNTSFARDDYFRIRMQEGVVIDLCNPAERVGEKATMALNTYLTLSDEERMFGFITVVDNSKTGDYTRNSQLI